MKKTIMVIVFGIMVTSLYGAGVAFAQSDTRFQDVPPDHPYYVEIETLAKSGLVEDAELFYPNTRVTRAQAAEMIARVSGKEPDLRRLMSEQADEFISADEFLRQAGREFELHTGAAGEVDIEGSSTLSRAEAAAALYRFWAEREFGPEADFMYQAQKEDLRQERIEAHRAERTRVVSGTAYRRVKVQDEKPHYPVRTPPTIEQLRRQIPAEAGDLRPTRYSFNQNETARSRAGLMSRAQLDKLLSEGMNRWTPDERQEEIQFNGLVYEGAFKMPAGQFPFLFDQSRFLADSDHRLLGVAFDPKGNLFFVAELSDNDTQSVIHVFSLNP